MPHVLECICISVCHVCFEQLGAAYTDILAWFAISVYRYTIIPYAFSSWGSVWPCKYVIKPPCWLYATKSWLINQQESTPRAAEQRETQAHGGWRRRWRAWSHHSDWRSQTCLHAWLAAALTTADLHVPDKCNYNRLRFAIIACIYNASSAVMLH